MPKWRKLWVKTLESPDFDALPDDFTRLLWVLLPLALDREGRCPRNRAWLRSRLFPLRSDVTLEMVGDAVLSLRREGMVEFYSVKKRAYLWCPSFAAHQGNTSKEAESLYPPPPSLEASPEEGESKSGVGQEQVESRSGTEADTEAEADTDTDVEAEADQPLAADTPIRDTMLVYKRLKELGIDDPVRTELTGSRWVTREYINRWWAYVQSWPDATDAVKLKSMICRMQDRRMVPPDFTGEDEP
jgi:hypothetical protein